MKTISSRDNPLFKELRQLAGSSQARRKAGKALLEGVHLCRAYLQHYGLPELAVVSDAQLQHAEVQQILTQCQSLKNLISLPDALFQQLSQVENGIGILFIVATPAAQLPAVLNESAVVLDGLQDPGNMGSILRSAAAAGVRHVLCGTGTVFAWSPKVLRAGMGAHFMLTIYEGLDLPAVLPALNLPMLATSSHTRQTIYQTDLKRPLIWLFGHEGQGVSQRLFEMASECVTIPQQPGLESMNVAASAAVCFFEQLRQQQFSA